MKLDRMEFADCTTPERLLQALFKQIPAPPIPVPVDEIALALDIERIQELETDGFEGGLVMFSDKSSGIILINKSSPRQRRRFTVGHELGHFLNPWHIPATNEGFRCTASDMRKFGSPPRNDNAAQMEVEANRFAAGLLMPDAQFRKDLRQLGGPEMQNILTLADKYDTSKEATARKYVVLHDEPCAIVFSKNGKMMYSLRGEDFPYLDVRKGQPLPKQSLSASSKLGQGEISDWEEMRPYVWLSNPKNVSSIAEQTLAQRDGYRMSLLYAQLDEPDDEDDDIEESWTPRFRK
jgi:Zn-dependent peptidase ImmA (M78 family)